MSEKFHSFNQILITSINNINYLDLVEYLHPKISRDAKIFPKGTVFYLLSGFHGGSDGSLGKSDSSLNGMFHYTSFNYLENFCGYLECTWCQEPLNLTKPCPSKSSVWRDMEYVIRLHAMYTEDQSDDDEEEESYELSERSRKDLIQFSKELLDFDNRTKPSAIILASCYSMYMNISDILRSFGIIAVLNISKDIGEVTEGKIFYMDAKQKEVLSKFRDVRKYKDL